MKFQNARRLSFFCIVFQIDYFQIKLGQYQARRIMGILLEESWKDEAKKDLTVELLAQVDFN